MSLADLMDTDFGKKEETKRILTPIEIAKLFQSAEGKPRDCMLIKCLYYFGLSNSEVQNLKKDDISFQEMKVRVVKGEKKRARYIAIPEGFGNELESFVSDSGEYVFSGRSKGLLSDRHIRRLVKSYACEAGLRDGSEINPHSLRNSYLSHVRNLGK
ncbi:MAG: tyrosine-type recombinase/integrase [Candidatus Aenigmatarchaeota archaeon]